MVDWLDHWTYALDMDISSLLLLASAPIFLLGMAIELLVIRLRRLPSYDRRDALLNIGTAACKPLGNTRPIIKRYVEVEEIKRITLTPSLQINSC